MLYFFLEWPWYSLVTYNVPKLHKKKENNDMYAAEWRASETPSGMQNPLI